MRARAMCVRSLRANHGNISSCFFGWVFRSLVLPFGYKLSTWLHQRLYMMPVGFFRKSEV